MLVLFQHQHQFVCGQQCGTVGRVGETTTDDRNRERNEFYIDRGNRAECAGMITSISYCFHQPQTEADEYIATVAVYTPASSDPDEEIFNVSSPSFTILKSSTELLAELNTTNFVCSKLSLPQPVSVAVGDVLGACLFDPPDSGDVTRYRLDLVSRAAGGTEDVVRTNTDSNIPNGCTVTEVPSSFDRRVSSTKTSSDRSLHLWANIILGESFIIYIMDV